MRGIDVADTMVARAQEKFAGDGSYSVSKLQRSIAAVRSFGADAVFAVGDFNIVGDVLARELPTVHLPTRVGVALSHGDHYLTPHREEGALRTPALLAGQGGMYGGFSFMMTPADAPSDDTRSSLALPEDAFLFAVVGNRLADELDRPFVTVIASILGAAPQAHLVLIGKDPGAGLMTHLPEALHGRTHVLGFTQSLGHVLGLCDASLNPFRTGGGLAAYTSLLAGTPVVTLAGSDAEVIVGRDQCSADTNAYTADAIRLAVDPSHLDGLRERTSDRLRGTPPFLKPGISSWPPSRQPVEPEPAP
jgi:hypothetical protein